MGIAKIKIKKNTSHNHQNNPSYSMSELEEEQPVGPTSSS